MAGTRITDLDPITAVEISPLDQLVLVDRDDLTMPDGTDKRCEIGELQGALETLMGLGTAAQSDVGDFVLSQGSAYVPASPAPIRLMTNGTVYGSTGATNVGYRSSFLQLVSKAPSAIDDAVISIDQVFQGFVVTDGVISGGTNLQSTVGGFTSGMTGQLAVCPGVIPAGTTVTFVDANNLTLSAASTNGSGLMVDVNPLIRTTGIHVKQYSPRDNGGDTSAILGLSTGGGPAGSFYKTAGRRPSGFADYSNSSQPALEVFNDGGSAGVLSIVGSSIFGITGHSADAYVARLDNAGAKGVLVVPGDAVFDTRVAYAVGNWIKNGPDINKTFSVLLNGDVVGRTLSMSGLTGATALARFVGATATGAPTSGTFSVGDWIIAVAEARVLICTVAGSPGTWGGQARPLGSAGGDLQGSYPNPTLANSVTVSGTLGAAAFASSGSPGAVQPARFMGATATGAPVSGTFSAGDYVVDIAEARLLICTVAGTPGTWGGQARPLGAAGGDLAGSTYPDPVIAAGAVTLSKMANLAASSFVGNNTGSAATPLALSVAQAKTLLALTKTDVGLSNVDNIADASKAFAGSQITSGTVAEARIDAAIARDSEMAATYQPLDPDLTAIATAGGGWLADTNTWTRTGNSTFTLSVDATGWLTPGTKISVSDTTTKYGVIITSVFSAGTTTVTLVTTSDYSLVSTLTVPLYSYAVNPVGWPRAFNWSPTLSGWSTNPTNAVYRWFTVGRNMNLIVRQGAVGTSNATSHTMTLPAAAASITNMAWAYVVKAIDATVTQAGEIVILSGGTGASLAGILATSNNTATGDSRIATGQVFYEFA